MMSFSVKGDVKKVLRDLKVLDKKIIPRAQKQARNKTLDRIYTQVIKKVSLKTGVKQKILRRKIKKYKARRADEESKIWVGSGLIKIGYLGRPKKQGEGVRVGKLTARHPTYKIHSKLFWGKGRLSGSKLYARVSKKRFPILNVHDDIRYNLALHANPVIKAIFPNLVKRFFPTEFTRALKRHL